MKSRIAILTIIFVAHAIAAYSADEAERRKIAASIQNAVNVPAPSMEMLMRALDISPNHTPYERCKISTEGLSMKIKGSDLECSFSPDRQDTVMLVDETPGNAYPIYWSIRTNLDGTMRIHGDDGKIVWLDHEGGKEMVSMGSNHLKLDVISDDIRILKAVRRLMELYRQQFPRKD